MRLKDLFLKLTNPKGYKLGIELLAEVNKQDADATKVATLLDQGAPVHLLDKENGFDAPMRVVLAERADILKVMLEKKSIEDINRKYASVNIMFGVVSVHSLLDWALGSMSRHDCAKLLIANGADVNQKRSNGYTLLMEALHMSSYAPSAADIAYLLIDNGADLMARDNKGETALHEAAKSHSETLVTALLDKEPALVNVADNKGRNALMRIMAHQSRAIDEIENAWAKVAEILVARGADLALKDADGKTALDLARENGRLPEVVKMLEDATAKIAPKKPSGPKPN